MSTQEFVNRRALVEAAAKLAEIEALCLDAYTKGRAAPPADAGCYYAFALGQVMALTQQERARLHDLYGVA